MKIDRLCPARAYILNAGLAGVEDADRLLLIGADPRVEAAVFNARIRKRWLQGGFKVGVIGQVGDQTYKTELLGDGLDGLAKQQISLKALRRPMVLVGVGALARADGAASWRKPARLAQSMMIGTALASCTRQQAGLAAWILASCRARTAQDR